MSLTYPSREEAVHYRCELQDAVAAARRGEKPEKDALAWPAGLDRALVRGLPIRTHTRNTLVRSKLMEGDNQLTVNEMLGTPEVGTTTVRNLLIGIDAFLGEYIETFDGRPGPANVAAMRLAREVQRLTPTEAVIVDERMLGRPPTKYHTLPMRLDMSSSWIRLRLVEAHRRLQIALEPESQDIAQALTADLGPSPRERVEAEVGYGLGLRRAPGVLTPYAGLSLGESGGRSWRIVAALA